MPIVRAELPHGTTDGRKQALRQAIKGAVAQAFQATAGIDRHDLYLLCRETEAENGDCGGQPLPNWAPADG